MATTDPRIDAYIARAAPFARPVLRHIRALVHRAVPGVDESIKWGMPHFLHHGMLCGMAAFKAHCTMSFWKGALVLPASARRDDEAMGQLGRLRSVDDLPSDRVLLGWLRRAATLNEEGVPVPRRTKAAPKREPAVPPSLARALARNGAARRAFAASSPSHRREYVEWIADAKREETRQRRVAQAVAWLAEGKSRNWKYQ